MVLKIVKDRLDQASTILYFFSFLYYKRWKTLMMRLLTKNLEL